MAPAGKPAPGGPVRPGPAAAVASPTGGAGGPAAGHAVPAREGDGLSGLNREPTARREPRLESPDFGRMEDVKACAWTTAVRLWTRPSPRRLGAVCSGTRGRAGGRPAAPAP